MTTEEIVQKYLQQKTAYEVSGNAILVPVGVDRIIAVCAELALRHHLPLKMMFAAEDKNAADAYNVFYVFGIPAENYFVVPYIAIGHNEGFPSLSKTLYPASIYEPRIYEMYGLFPVGFPGKLQPAVLHNIEGARPFPMRKSGANAGKIEGGTFNYAFQEVDGEGVFEVPVGPVHAGIIEPGHFRFSMAGETIIHLEARLGWVHKGIEGLFVTKKIGDQIALAERVAGDTSFAHSLAYCQAIESLSQITVDRSARFYRVIFNELERLSNHLNDMGYILSDTGFNFGGAGLTRLRERMMLLNERVTGSRFLRGLNTIGGVTKALSEEHRRAIVNELEYLTKELRGVLRISTESGILLNRLEKTGTLTQGVAIKHNAVGVPARASGVDVDARRDFPYAAYDVIRPNVAIELAGDVLARFTVRQREAFDAIRMIIEALDSLPDKNWIPVARKYELRKNTYAIGIAEGWRGEIIYAIGTDTRGDIVRVAVRDPSVINWHLIPHCAPGNVLLDFPLINKSFNLSYSGNDL